MPPAPTHALRVLAGITLNLGGRPVLRDLTLDLLPGAINCLLGPSGCGKSTLLRVVAGLLAPDRGTVGVSPQDCAMVFQDSRLLPWLSVAENLALALHAVPRRQRRPRIAAILGRMGLADTEDLMPAQLSGGMAQRVGIARALLREPAVLLMDEPFAALDAITRASLQDMVRELAASRRMTCLFVTHDIHEALLLGQRVMVLRDGVIRLGFDDVAARADTARAAILAELNPNLHEASSRPTGHLQGNSA